MRYSNILLVGTVAASAACGFSPAELAIEPCTVACDAGSAGGDVFDLPHGDTGSEGDAAAAGDARSHGDSNLQGDAGAGDDLGLAGDSSLGGDSNLQGDSFLPGDSNMLGDSNFGGDSNLAGDSSPGGDSSLWGDVDTALIDRDGDGVPGSQDCDDTPGSGFSCSVGCSFFYIDQDSDGFGDPLSQITACVAPAGYVGNATDCDDDPKVCGAACFPGGSESSESSECNGVDDDCDGQVDEDFVADITCFGKGVCGATGTASSCIQGVKDLCINGTPTGIDESICNGVDDDCDDSIDEDFVDSDKSCFRVGVCADGNVASSCVDGVGSPCSTGGAETEYLGVSGTCSDTLDNDCDGSADLKDADCDADPWWDNNWTRRVKLNLSNPSGLPLVQFPLMVRLDDTRVDFSAFAPGGADVRFVSASAAPLPHEVEDWSVGGGGSLPRALVWVAVPILKVGGMLGQYIWLYYGNVGAATAEDPAGVWDSDYSLVWHMNDKPGTEIVDSTGRTPGTRISQGGPTRVPGSLAGGQLFDGLDDGLMNVTASSSASITVEAWVKPAQISAGWDTLVEYGDDVPWVGFTSDRLTYTLPGGSGGWSAFGIPLNEFAHVTITHDGSSLVFYGNGGDQQLTVNYNKTGTGTGLFVGASLSDQPLHGVIDELRISTVVRSPAWISTQHASMVDTLINYGVEQRQ